jgi:hypothetical protein
MTFLYLFLVIRDIIGQKNKRKSFVGTGHMKTWIQLNTNTYQYVFMVPHFQVTLPLRLCVIHYVLFVTYTIIWTN